jgi:hypothetical protein
MAGFQPPPHYRAPNRPPLIFRIDDPSRFSRWSLISSLDRLADRSVLARRRSRSAETGIFE